MKKLILFGLLLTFCLSGLSAQESLHIGDPAPTITITDWMYNVPDDTDLNGKFIVLEFWATWCGPCIKAIPHINELKTSLGDRDDILFISISDESIERVQKGIDRYDFQTTVVTDVTRTTKRGFKVRGIPKTILIDNKGIIQWVGHAMELDKDKLDRFLNGQSIALEEHDHAGKHGYGDRAKLFNEYLKNSENYFEIGEVEGYKNGKGFGTSNGVYYVGVKLENILAELMGVSLLEIEIPEEFKDRQFEIVYTNKNKELSYEERDRRLMNKILKEFDWKFSKEKKESLVYEIKVADKNLLTVSTLRNRSGGSKTKEEVIFRNLNMEEISNRMSDELNIFIVDKTNLQETYDMTLSFKNLEAFERI